MSQKEIAAHSVETKPKPSTFAQEILTQISGKANDIYDNLPRGWKVDRNKRNGLIECTRNFPANDTDVSFYYDRLLATTEGDTDAETLAAFQIKRHTVTNNSQDQFGISVTKGGDVYLLTSEVNNHGVRAPKRELVSDPTELQELNEALDIELDSLHDAEMSAEAAAPWPPEPEI